MKKLNKKKKYLILFVMIFILLMVIVFLLNGFKVFFDSYRKPSVVVHDVTEVEIVNKDDLISNCVKKEKVEYDLILNEKINALKDLFKNDSMAVSFYYEDLTTGDVISFNENENMFAASVTKAPVDIYIYKLASEGMIDLDEKLTYTSAHKRGGTGILKNKSLNTTYTIRELVNYSVIYSDNAAHSMLVTRFNMQEIKKYWQNLGATSIFVDNTLFSKLNSKDGALYMKYFYNFYLTGDDLAQELMSYFESVKFTLVNFDGEKVAHKYGWTKNYLHDVAIIESQHPFVLSVMSLKGNSNYKLFYNNVSSLAGEIHQLIWENRNNYCALKYES